MPVEIARSLDDLKVINQLLFSFALLGLFLAAVGIYGVIARLVIQRTGEIGIRMALGAQMRDVVNLILGAGLRMALLGAVIGLAGAAALARFFAATMPALASDTTTGVAFATITLVTVAVGACWLPARRATKVDPIVALRAE
jgi:ABC-type antimicrobial peptide transport system permease subunit